MSRLRPKKTKQYRVSSTTGNVPKAQTVSVDPIMKKINFGIFQIEINQFNI